MGKNSRSGFWVACPGRQRGKVCENWTIWVQKSVKKPSETGKIRLHGGARLLGLLSRIGENFKKIDEQFNSNMWYINKVKLKSSNNIKNPLTGTETPMLIDNQDRRLSDNIKNPQTGTEATNIFSSFGNLLLEFSNNNRAGKIKPSLLE